MTLKLRATDGSLVWESFHDGPPGLAEGPPLLAVDAAGGGVAVAGSSIGRAGELQIATVKYDRHGRLLWRVHEDGGFGGKDSIQALAVDRFGNVYVTGFASDPSRPHAIRAQLVIRKLDRAGAVLWTALREERHPPDSLLTRLAAHGPLFECGSGNLTASQLARIDTNGALYIGTGTGGWERSDFLALAYSPAGELLWAATYDGPEGGRDFVSSIAVDPDGTPVVAGEVASGEGTRGRAQPGGRQVQARRATGVGPRTKLGDERGLPRTTVDRDRNVHVAFGLSRRLDLRRFRIHTALLALDRDGRELSFSARREPRAVSGAPMTDIIADRRGNAYFGVSHDDILVVKNALTDAPADLLRGDCDGNGAAAPLPGLRPRLARRPRDPRLRGERVHAVKAGGGGPTGTRENLSGSMSRGEVLRLLAIIAGAGILSLGLTATHDGQIERDVHLHLAVARDCARSGLDLSTCDAGIGAGTLAALPADRQPLFHVLLALLLRAGLGDSTAARLMPALAAALAGGVLYWHSRSILAIPCVLLGTAFLVRERYRLAGAVNVIYTLLYSVPVLRRLQPGRSPACMPSPRRRRRSPPRGPSIGARRNGFETTPRGQSSSTPTSRRFPSSGTSARGRFTILPGLDPFFVAAREPETYAAIRRAVAGELSLEEVRRLLRCRCVVVETGPPLSMMTFHHGRIPHHDERVVVIDAGPLPRPAGETRRHPAVIPPSSRGQPAVSPPGAPTGSAMRRARR